MRFYKKFESLSQIIIDNRFKSSDNYFSSHVFMEISVQKKTKLGKRFGLSKISLIDLIVPSSNLNNTSNASIK